MNTTHPAPRPCPLCQLCRRELIELQEMWEQQSRAIAVLQVQLANHTYFKGNVGKRAGPAA